MTFRLADQGPEPIAPLSALQPASIIGLAAIARLASPAVPNCSRSGKASSSEPRLLQTMSALCSICR